MVGDLEYPHRQACLPRQGKSHPDTGRSLQSCIFIVQESGRSYSPATWTPPNPWLPHPSYRDFFRSLDMRTYDSSSSISLSHTQTQTLSPRVSYFSIVLLYVAHTHSLSLEISCVPSYVSLAITLVVKYLSLSQTQNSISRDLISLWYLFVCDSHAPSLYLSHTHTHNSAFWSTWLLSLTHTS